MVAEFDGQPVEQFRVGGQFTLRAEVIEDRGKSGAMEDLPEPVGEGARRDRVLLRGQPVGEVEAREALLLGALPLARQE